MTLGFGAGEPSHDVVHVNAKPHRQSEEQRFRHCGKELPPCAARQKTRKADAPTSGSYSKPVSALPFARRIELKRVDSVPKGPVFASIYAIDFATAHLVPKSTGTATGPVTAMPMSRGENNDS